MKAKVRSSLTLLEVSIALFLTGILLSSLVELYREWLISFQEVQKKEILAHKYLFLKHRLQQISALLAKREDPIFFSLEENMEGFPALCFSYDNAPDPDPSFNGPVTSTLYVDSKKNLCLKTVSKKNEIRLEILFHPISSFSPSYFDLQTNLWKDDWPKSFNEIPLWVRFKIESPEEQTLIDPIIQTSFPSDPVLYLETQELKS
jgi:type II secretory pathway component PulJ